MNNSQPIEIGLFPAITRFLMSPLRYAPTGRRAAPPHIDIQSHALHFAWPEELWRPRRWESSQALADSRPASDRPIESSPGQEQRPARMVWGGIGLCDVACAVLTYGASFLLLPLLLGLPQVIAVDMTSG